MRLECSVYPRGASAVVILVAFFMLGVAGRAAPPSGYRLHFADEFSGDSLDSVKWIDKYPWSRTHNHEAYMAPGNVVFGDGTVTLVGERESHPNSAKPFTSGAISTGYSKYAFTGGYVEARVLLPDTPGSWPAFWGLYTGWPPEADILEYPIRAEAGRGYLETEYHTAWHYRTTSGGNSAGAGRVNPSGVGDLGGAYHTFGMEWREDDWVGYYFDGQLVSQFGNDAAIGQMEHMYLILNYAIGGWPGMPSQTQWADGHADEFKIDWVRVWQEEDADTTHRWTGGAGNSWNSDDNWSRTAPGHGTQVARFGTVGGRGTTVDWTKLKTVGSVYFDGTTQYTLGSGDESLMFAGDGGEHWSQLRVTDGSANHVIRSRIESWSNLTIANERDGTLTLAGELYSHARQDGGGALAFEGGGEIVLNAPARQQRETVIREATTVIANAGLYQNGVVHDDAVLTIEGGSTLVLNDLDDLGGLSPSNRSLSLDGGTIRLQSTTDSSRSFKIGPAGARIIAAPESNIRLASGTGREAIIDSTAGGDLTLAGEGDALFDKVLRYGGGLVKEGAGRWSVTQPLLNTGATRVLEGELEVAGRLGAGDAVVGAEGLLSGDGAVGGDLVVEGAVSPGSGYAVFSVDGDLSLLTGGELVLGIAPRETDRLVIGGSMAIGGGTLRIESLPGFTPAPGASFDLLDFESATGSFAVLDLPALPAGDVWDITELDSNGVIQVALAGDYNADGSVDAADYTVWRDHLGGSHLPNRAASAAGPVGQADYDAWAANFGRSFDNRSAAVPEPSSWLAAALVLAAPMTGRKEASE